MANILIFSKLNPVQFYKDVPDVNAQFNSKHIDDWYFENTILTFEQKTGFCLPWQRTDIIQMQLQCNYAPINLQVFRTYDDALIDTVPFLQIMANANDPSLFIYEIDLNLATYAIGGYYFKITFGSPVVLTMRSENIILSENSENTLLLSYSHPRMYGDMIFETGFATSLRIPGTLKLKAPASKDTSFEDQILNMTMLRSVPYRVWRFRIGISEGVPDYLIDKINWILGCQNLQIDGKYYTKNEGATLEESAEERYPMRGWSIDMREKINRASRIYENESPQDVFVAAMVSSDSKGFGADNGGNESVVEDVI